jgi:hypothetical protein
MEVTSGVRMTKPVLQADAQDEDPKGLVAGSDAAQELERSIRWYSENGGRTRLCHQILEVALLVVGSSIAVVALAVPGNGLPTAVLGAVVVILTGLRQVFHWHENYVRFTNACLALKAERRRYSAGKKPYDDESTRDKVLVEAINRVETEETQGWSELMKNKAVDQTTKT